MNGETCSLAQEFARELKRREGDRLNQVREQLLTSPDLYRAVMRDIYSRIPGAVADALAGAYQIFQRCDRTFEVALCLVYMSEATICHARNLDALEDFCRICYDVCGVTQFEVRGSDLYWRIQRAPEGRWISTTMGGGV